jgi:uncharacterized protein YggU (UPF0235/DUF167 family)
MQIKVRVIPRAKQNKIAVESDGSIKIHTTSAPADGKANEAVIALLAEHLGLAKSRIKIIRGETVRNKIISVHD